VTGWRADAGRVRSPAGRVSTGICGRWGRRAARMCRMDADVQAYVDGIAAEHRPLFDRVHRLILQARPEADLVLSYGMPAYRAGSRKLHVGVWQHGVSLYGWNKERNAAFTARHPELLSGKATIRLRSGDAAQVTDEELSALIRTSLDA